MYFVSFNHTFSNPSSDLWSSLERIVSSVAIWGLGFFNERTLIPSKGASTFTKTKVEADLWRLRWCLELRKGKKEEDIYQSMYISTLARASNPCGNQWSLTWYFWARYRSIVWLGLILHQKRVRKWEQKLEDWALPLVENKAIALYYWCFLPGIPISWGGKGASCTIARTLPRGAPRLRKK